jgi:tetratricopeptide (TPR) repeat protein
MSHLSKDEILSLLDTMDADDIRTVKADQLNETGRNFLQEIEKDIQTGQDLFMQYGQRFQEADDHLLSQEEKSPKDPALFEEHLEIQRPANGSKRRTRGVRLPLWSLAAAAALVLAFALLPPPFAWDVPPQTRGRSIDVGRINQYNEPLVEALIDRGEYLYEVGNQEGKRAHYEEARDDLMQAYELEPKNTRLLSLLARVHEKLGQDKDARQYLEEWKSAQE